MKINLTIDPLLNVSPGLVLLGKSGLNVGFCKRREAVWQELQQVTRIRILLRSASTAKRADCTCMHELLQESRRLQEDGRAISLVT